ncbi:YciI family protein [Caulobacter sp. KR2-114]|uniref:YciI family protein n=1 Tax=Caulobacter sp. KR2-114 TaxID=3400912 RepID=UPI003C07C836
MPTFLLMNVDKPDSLALRMANREAHLDYCRANAGIIRLGGPLLSDGGDMAGSMLVLETADAAQAQAFSDNDPYTLAGLFERREVRPFKVTLGALG